MSNDFKKDQVQFVSSDSEYDNSKNYPSSNQSESEEDSKLGQSPKAITDLVSPRLPGKIECGFSITPAPPNKESSNCNRWFRFGFWLVVGLTPVSVGISSFFENSKTYLNSIAGSSEVTVFGIIIAILTLILFIKSNKSTEMIVIDNDQSMSKLSSTSCNASHKSNSA